MGRKQRRATPRGGPRARLPRGPVQLPKVCPGDRSALCELRGKPRPPRATARRGRCFCPLRLHLPAASAGRRCSARPQPRAAGSSRGSPASQGSDNVLRHPLSLCASSSLNVKSAESQLERILVDHLGHLGYHLGHLGLALLDNLGHLAYHLGHPAPRCTPACYPYLCEAW